MRRSSYEGREGELENLIIMQFDNHGNFCISEEEIIQVIYHALKRLVTEDMHLFKSGVQERALQFKLALYLRELLKIAECGGVYIDVEYNRDGESDVKRPNPNNDKKWFAPDIILHERGSANYKCYDQYKNDIIYCEIKKKSKSGKPDAARIKKQMRVRKYQYGIDIYSLRLNNISLDLYVLVNNRFDKKSYEYNFSEDRLNEITS